MQGKNRITRFLIGIFALTMFWGIFMVSRFILEISDNENLKHVPADARFVMVLNGRRLLEEGFNTVILAEDEGIIRLIEELYKRKSQGKQERARLGIDYNSDIVFFSKNYDSVLVDGLIINLDQPHLFRKNIGEFISKNQAYSANDHVGVILTQHDMEGQRNLTAADLQIQAAKVLQEESSVLNEYSNRQRDENSIATTISNDGFLRESDLIRNTNLSFDLTENKVTVSGKVDLKLHMHQHLSKRLSPDGIHFTAKALSRNVKDSISQYFAGFNLPTEHLCGISLNYHGVKIVDDPTLLYIPLIDALMKFDQPVDFHAELDSLEAKWNASEYEDVFKQSGHSFEYGGIKFYWQQYEDNSIYIGLQEVPKIIDYGGNEVFLLDGRLDRLTNIESTKRMQRILDFFPQYTASKALSLKINTCHISITQDKGDHYNMSGEIDFIKDQHAINAFLSFLIESQVL